MIDRRCYARRRETPLEAGEGSALLYREHAPHPALSTLVRCYWTLSLPAGLPATAAQQVLAEGVELAFNLADPIVVASDERRSVIARRTCLSGPMTRPMLLRPTGRVEMVGVCFRPGGAYPFVRAPARELQDRQLEVEDVWGARSAAMVEQIRDERLGTPQRIDLLDRQLLDRLEARRTRMDVAFAAALRLIDERRGRVRVDGVARAVGVSSRQLERSFLERVGLSPRQLCRSLRFKSVFGHRAASPGDSWTAVALDCGYCDQSHLIREFKHYTGASPEAYFSRPGPGSLFVGNF